MSCNLLRKTGACHQRGLNHRPSNEDKDDGLEAVSVTSRKDPRVLLRYTHLRAEDLVERLGQKKALHEPGYQTHTT